MALPCLTKGGGCGYSVTGTRDFSRWFHRSAFLGYSPLFLGGMFWYHPLVCSCSGCCARAVKMVVGGASNSGVVDVRSNRVFMDRECSWMEYDYERPMFVGGGTVHTPA